MPVRSVITNSGWNVMDCNFVLSVDVSVKQSEGGEGDGGDEGEGDACEKCNNKFWLEREGEGGEGESEGKKVKVVKVKGVKVKVKTKRRW